MRFPARRAPCGALAAAQTVAGEQLLGTRDKLVLPDRTLRWEDILTASWNSDADKLTLQLVEPEVIEVELVDPTDLLQLVRERVTASVLLATRVPIGDLGFTLMVRRPPGGGPISMVVEYDRGLDPDAPEVASAVLAAQAQAHYELGM